MAVINGTAGSDTLTDTSGSDTINGFAGDDTINGGRGGTDVVNGGDGRDSLQFMTASTAVIVDFVAGTAGSTSFTGIERVVTGDFNDRLSGNAAAQNLTARAGADTLAGAGGIDTLWGGSGADTFVFRENGAGNADSIGDWTSGSDKLLLDGTVMAALGASGNFAAGDARFVSNSSGTALDASDRIIYETDTRQVWYDADGSGAGARQLIATLQSGATLVATDIVVEGGGGGGPGPIVGTEGNDTLTGTNGDDTIDGRGGNDRLTGMDGNDSLLGGAGNDFLDGLSGSFFDFIYTIEDPSGGRVDTLNGGLGDDTYVPSGEDLLSDPGGTDTVIATDMNWTLGAGFENLVLDNGASEGGYVGIGNELANVISVNWAASRLEGRGGDDTLRAAGGQGDSNTLLGQDGNDSLVGNSLPDLLDGGAGNDTLFGGRADDYVDTLIGGAGVDTFVVEPRLFSIQAYDAFSDFTSGTDKMRLDGNDFAATGPSGNFAPNDERFYAAPGATSGHDATDRVVYNTTTGEVFYDDDGSGGGTAQLIAFVDDLAAVDIVVINGAAAGGSVVNGTSGADTLSGTGGNDTINGLGGDDTIIHGSGGTDVIDGGTGRDSLTFMTATGAVVADFVSGTISGGGPGTASFTNIERLVTGDFNDRLTGNAAAQNLTARGGADTLEGAAGLDTLWGGAGADIFVFREMGAANADRIGDWSSGSDKVHLDDAAFTAVGATGNFASGDGRFWSAAGATSGHDSNDRVIYNTSTGSLYYDGDGSGSGAAQLIATLTGLPGVAASDIVVI
jgi:Ca2+-binding RTX toxin-like protein